MSSMTQRKRMENGLAHRPDDGELALLRRAAKDILYEYNILTRPSDKARRAELMGKLLGSAASVPHINQPFYCDYGVYIRIGKNFFANHNCTILDSGGVTIGDNVMFAPNVALYTVSHPLDAELRGEQWEHGAHITIGDNVWIGGSAVVLGGVSIGANSVIAAGAVVTRDIPPDSLAAGVPARVIRRISETDQTEYRRKYLQEAV